MTSIGRSLPIMVKSALVKSDAIGGQVECKRVVKWCAVSHSPSGRVSTVMLAH
jgi:hypothetical protein